MKKEIFYTKKEIKKTKIAILSDIHYYYPNFNLNIFKKIIKQIKNNNPDYTCICGDILDDSKYENLNMLKSFLEELASLSKVIVILGNHDQKSGNLEDWNYHKNKTLENMLKSINNLHYLDDDIYQENNVTFYGFNLSYHHYETEDESYETFKKEADKLKCPLKDENYNITLFHSPINIYQYIEKNPLSNLSKSDLILSGHTHNGCIPYFLTNIINKRFKTNSSLVAPNRSFFPKYSQGRVYKIKNGYIYEGVTKLSKSTKLFHYFNFLYPIHVKFIEIKKSNS